jgi:NAD(P)-dependent dehydrogenase (short-subunit alcohol dehydrogenase family)
MPSVVVTGVSTGIGWGAVKVLTQKGLHVFGSVRKQADADRLKAEYGDKFSPLLFDVTDETAVRAGAAYVRDRMQGETLAGLVNNAGIAIGGPMLHQPLKDFRAQIDVNLIGAFIATQAFLPQLGADLTLKGKPGRVVNISSMGGRIGSPFLGGYCAAKHGLEGFSESLRRELMIYGIDVLILGPGAVATPIWDKAEGQDISQYAGTQYGEMLAKWAKGFYEDGRKGLSVERLGEEIHRALIEPSQPARRGVAPSWFFDWFLPSRLPVRWVDAAFRGRLGMKPLKRKSS